MNNSYKAGILAIICLLLTILFLILSINSQRKSGSYAPSYYGVGFCISFLYFMICLLIYLEK